MPLQADVVSLRAVCSRCSHVTGKWITAMGRKGTRSKNQASGGEGPQLAQEAKHTLEKYKELYMYSTDILLKEHDRFLRADDKATKYSTMFVFLLGTSAFFGKWILGKFDWPDFPVGLPEEWPLFVVGTLALISSAVGWFLASYVIKLRPYKSRPLNKDVLEFFDKQTLLNIYDSFARRNIDDYEANVRQTNAKLRLQVWAHRVMLLVLLLLGELAFMYCLYSWL